MIRFFFALTIMLAFCATRADVAVLTQHNDLARTGANLAETTLNVANVNTNSFGLVFTRTVDDQIYAQPLIMTNVNLGTNGIHNIVIVATVNDSVYAFDADNASSNAPYWQVNFLGPNVVAPSNTNMTGACGGNYKDFSGRMGIVGTPVIDPTNGTVYLVARTLENGTTYVQRLHALDVATGNERPNSPVIITATCPGTGEGGSTITFNSQKQNQRAGLALVNGIVYISWTSHCDWGPYHGWVIGYDMSTLQQAVVYNDTPNGSQGGIWMSGQAPAADASGNLFISTGNGTVGTTSNRRDTTNRGESFLKLTRSGTNLTVASFFTPYNFTNLENGDIDLGSAGLILIPGTSLTLSGGKEGKFYLVNRDNMGGLSSSTTADTNIIQSWSLGSRQIHCGPVWWDGPDGSYVYVQGATDKLRQYKFNFGTGMFDMPNFAQSATSAASGQPGGIMSLSANGTNASSGILWVTHNLVGDANQSVRPGILRAYNAQNVTNELWNSEQITNRDSVGNLAKFVPPTVANGKVYLATFSNRLNVYGLLPRPQLGISQAGNTITLSWPTNGFAGYKVQTNSTPLTTNWFDSGNTLVITNGTYQTTISISSTSVFYRLKR